MSETKKALQKLDERVRGLKDEQPARMAPAIVGAKELSKGNPWVIHYEDSATPAVDMINRQVILPEVDTDQTRSVRAHEIGHMKFSPQCTPKEWADKEKVPVESLVAVEEYRVNAANRRKFPDYVPEIYEKGYTPIARERALEAMKVFLENPTGPLGNDATLIENLLGFNTGTQEEMRSYQDEFMAVEAHSNHPKAQRLEIATRTARDLANHIERDLFDPETTVTVTKRLRSLKRNIQKAEEQAEHGKPEDNKDKLDNADKKVLAETLPGHMLDDIPQDASAEDIIQEMVKQARRKTPNTPETIQKQKKAQQARRHGRHGTQEGPNDGWGNMEIIKPSLSRKAKPGLRGTRLSSTGFIVTDPSRWFTDQDRRVFGVKAKIDKCSILVDCSGSMGFGTDELQEVLDNLPGSWIAGYSGTGIQGQLVVWARNKRRCAKDDFPQPYGGQNQVDVPALKELAKQPGPRIWISDGHAHFSGCFNERMAKQMATIVKQAGIIRMEHDEFREFFKLPSRREEF